MPGVLIVEAFGQAAAALTAHSVDPKEIENKLVYLMSVEKARFRNPVMPDCELKLYIEAIRSHGRVWKYKGVAKVNDKEMADAQGAETVIISAAMEAEIAQLDSEEDKRDFLEAAGLEEPGLNRVIKAGYNLLNLITFFTAGPKEARAWTVERDSKAPQAAGVIHTDFERGFIKAETIAYDDYSNLGGEQKAKEAGKMRQEGKEYVVQDGDILLFRFNV